MARRYRFFLGFQSIVHRLYGKFFLLHPGPGKSRSKELNIADPRVVRGEEHLLDLAADVDLDEECGLETREQDRGGIGGVCGSSSGGSAFEEAEEVPGEKAADEGFRRQRTEEIGGRQRHFMTEVITVIDD
jgi:hypothetical protein